jgi:uncharacterized protein
VARTLFLGTAPSSAGTKVTIRGIDRARVILGCVQPGQTSSVYSDALNRLADRLHYLNSSGDKAQDATRFWYDTRANLRREMEDRKRRFDDKTEVRGKIAEALKQGAGNTTFFDGAHIFTPHGDVPEDSALRLVVLPSDKWYSREEPRLAFETVMEWMRNNGAKPRHHWNRLLFLAADHTTLSRLSDAARECYRWLLCPMQETPTDKPGVEAFPLNTTGGSVGREMERVCGDNELVITTWSPIHLRTKLKELYWKEGQPTAGALAFWEDTLRYLYLPRVKDRDVLALAIRTGAASRDFFGTAYGQHDGKYDGFQLGGDSVQLGDTLLLIEPEAAGLYKASQRKPATTSPEGAGGSGEAETPASGTGAGAGGVDRGKTPVGVSGAPRSRSFHATVDVAPATAKMRLVQIADEIVAVLGSDPNASVKVVVEISPDFPDGAKDGVKRAVSENARSLGLKSADWE